MALAFLLECFGDKTLQCFFVCLFLWVTAKESPVEEVKPVRRPKAPDLVQIKYMAVLEGQTVQSAVS